jgi:hypothetical protein
MKIKVRHLPNAVIPAGRSDYFVLAQTSGGQVTRKLTMSQLASTLFTSGSYISISNGVISANASGINALLRPEIAALASKVSSLESKFNSFQPTQTIFFDATHISGGGQGATSPSSTVLNLAKAVIPGPPPGSYIIIKWKRYWTYRWGNGGASATEYMLSVYYARSATSWVVSSVRKIA